MSSRAESYDGKMHLKVQKIDTEKVYANCLFMNPQDFKKGFYLEVQAGRSQSQNFLFAVKKEDSIARGCYLFIHSKNYFSLL